MGSSFLHIMKVSGLLPLLVITSLLPPCFCNQTNLGGESEPEQTSSPEPEKENEPEPEEEPSEEPVEEPDPEKEAPEPEAEVNGTTCRCEKLQTRIFEEINDRSGCADVAKGVYTALGACSIIALVLTLVVYVTVPKMMDLNGKIVVSCAFSTLLATLYLVIVYNYHWPCTTQCTVLGYFGLFTTLSMFSWMTIMCLNMVLMFKSMRSGGDAGSRFLIYSAIGWGVPFLFSVTTGILQKTTDRKSSFNPDIGTESCFVDDHVPYRQLIFFHLPIFLLLMANLAGFIYCAVYITSTQRNRERSKHGVGENASCLEKLGLDKDTRQQVVIYGKLFMIFGLPWLSESIQYFVNRDHLHNGVAMIEPVTCKTGFSPTIFRMASGYNLLRGVFLFVMFVCKTPVIRRVKRRVGMSDVSSSTAASKKTASDLSQSDSQSMVTMVATPETGRRWGTTQARKRTNEEEPTRDRIVTE